MTSVMQQQNQPESSRTVGSASGEPLLNPPLRFLPVAFGMTTSKSRNTVGAHRGTSRAKEVDSGGGSSGSADNGRAGGEGTSSSTLRSRSAKESLRDTTPGAASEALYRGSFPRPRHLAFLRRLELRTVVSLTPKSIEQYAKEDGGSAETLAWCRENGIKVVHIKCEKAKEVETIAISPQAALEAIRVILDVDHLPLYMHDLDGQTTIPLILALIRKLQGWSYASLHAELHRTLREVPSEGLPKSVTDFIKTFGQTLIPLTISPDADAPVPPRSNKNVNLRLGRRAKLPTWLWPDSLPHHTSAKAYKELQKSGSREAITLSALRDPWAWHNVEKEFQAWWREGRNERFEKQTSNGSQEIDSEEEGSGALAASTASLPSAHEHFTTSSALTDVTTAWSARDVARFIAQATAQGSLLLPVVHPHIARLGFDPESEDWYVQHPPHSSHPLSVHHNLHHHHPSHERGLVNTSSATSHHGYTSTLDSLKRGSSSSNLTSLSSSSTLVSTGMSRSRSRPQSVIINSGHAGLQFDSSHLRHHSAGVGTVPARARSGTSTPSPRVSHVPYSASSQGYDVGGAASPKRALAPPSAPRTPRRSFSAATPGSSSGDDSSPGANVKAVSETTNSGLGLGIQDGQQSHFSERAHPEQLAERLSKLSHSTGERSDVSAFDQTMERSPTRSRQLQTLQQETEDQHSTPRARPSAPSSARQTGRDEMTCSAELGQDPNRLWTRARLESEGQSDTDVRDHDSQEAVRASQLLSKRLIASIGGHDTSAGDTGADMTPTRSTEGQKVLRPGALIERTVPSPDTISRRSTVGALDSAFNPNATSARSGQDGDDLSTSPNSYLPADRRPRPSDETEEETETETETETDEVLEEEETLDEEDDEENLEEEDDEDDTGLRDDLALEALDLEGY